MKEPPEREPPRPSESWARGGECGSSTDTTKLAEVGSDASNIRRCVRCLRIVRNANCAGHDGRALSGEIVCELCVREVELLPTLPRRERVKIGLRHLREVSARRKRITESAACATEGERRDGELRAKVRIEAAAIQDEFATIYRAMAQLCAALGDLNSRFDLPERQRLPLLLADLIRRDVVVLIHGLHRRFGQ